LPCFKPLQLQCEQSLAGSNIWWNWPGWFARTRKARGRN